MLLFYGHAVGHKTCLVKHGLCQITLDKITNFYW